MLSIPRQPSPPANGSHMSPCVPRVIESWPQRRTPSYHPVQMLGSFHALRNTEIAPGTHAYLRSSLGFWDSRSEPLNWCNLRSVPSPTCWTHRSEEKRGHYSRNSPSKAPWHQGPWGTIPLSSLPSPSSAFLLLSFSRIHWAPSLCQTHGAENRSTWVLHPMYFLSLVISTTKRIPAGVSSNTNQDGIWAHGSLHPSSLPTPLCPLLLRWKTLAPLAPLFIKDTIW